ncbi:MAG: trans-sulfuration enzyme family protein [Bacillota bacterium]|jgi:cystathionine beta-lyase/cystathionine gamma-synthase
MKKTITWETMAARAGKHTPMPTSIPTVHPIYQTSVFTFKSLEQMDEAFDGQPGGYTYSRIHNPNHAVLEQALAELEGGESAVVTSSGMAAILIACLGHLNQGERMLVTRDCYGGTEVQFAQELRRLGIDVQFVDFYDHAATERALQAGAKIVYLETISNPLMKVADIGALSQLAHQHGALVLIDNTFASPYVCQPLSLGADLVIHSLTKYINGHSDVMGGAVVGSTQLIQPIKRAAINLGPTPSSFDCWLVLRGMKTLALRMERHSSNALALAEMLQVHPAVHRVFYPGLPGDPEHALAAAQFRKGFGGMLSFEVAGGADQAEAVIRALQLVELVPSLAGICTTISHPAKASHRGLTAEQRRALGISDGLIRLSVGIEDIDDLKADFAQALDGIAGLASR